MPNTIFKSIILIFCLLSFPSQEDLFGQLDFQKGSLLQYLKGKDADSLGLGWMNPGFDDTSWDQGQAPLRYGDGTGGTLLDDMQYNYSVVYMRTTFLAGQVDSLVDFRCLVDYDDGFVVWINGRKVISRNAPAGLDYNGFSTDMRESGVDELFFLDPADFDLVEGENTLAIQGFNTSLESTDFHMDLSLNARVNVPVLEDPVGLNFSMASGFYEDSFTLEITPSDTSWYVTYTLDGSNPQTSETAEISKGKATILIDPENIEGRPKTPAVVLRASSFIPGIKPSTPESRSYIFLKQVLTQSYPSGGWPVSSVNGQAIDLRMDSRVVNSSVYKDLMIPALTDIPSISVISDLDHLFHPLTGIYVNADGHGHEWERECSVELINPDGSPGFEVNAGLRIRGGWSRHPEFPKHAFRLFFRSEYGDAKLNFPLFGEEGVDQFDKIDLRTSQNYAWSNGDDKNTFLRDVFSRDTQGDMGNPYTRSRYYHLYLNGMYWGLYQTQERPEARFAADYLGGKADDYDVIKVNTEGWIYQIEATDGNHNKWYELWDMCKTGFVSNSDYFRLEGKDGDGKPIKGGEVYVDLDNLIDYMLVIFYTANFDSPTTTFGSNKGPNNFYAINSRTDLSKGFTFYAHDAEHSMFAEEVPPGLGLNEDRVNLTKRTDGNHMDVDHFGSFHPQWLHHKLSFNPEYQIRFMDRAHLHLTAWGTLTPGVVNSRLDQRALEIDKAIIAESARWGDGRPWVTTPHTRNENWVPEVQKIKEDFFPYRTGIVIDQLKEAGLYTSLDPPVAYVNSELVSSSRYFLSEVTSLRLENKNMEGAICYTLNGTDPRLPGGEISPDVVKTDNQREVIRLRSSAVMKARIFSNGTWSALMHLDVISEEEDFSKLVMTELHYHPPGLPVDGDTISGKDLEFIELKNTGEVAINLSGLFLDSAVTYEFPEHTLLAPGQFYVIASKPSAFYLRYGLVASGNYKKNLSNGGEEVLLADQNGSPLIRFTYSDKPPWDQEADGYGYSLVSASDFPNPHPSFYSDWRMSGAMGGSPFADDSETATFTLPDAAQPEIQLFPNPTSGLLHVKLPPEVKPQGAMLHLYGIKGNLVHSLVLQGNTTLDLNPLNIPSGIYIVRIQAGTGIYTSKVIYQ